MKKKIPIQNIRWILWWILLAMILVSYNYLGIIIQSMYGTIIQHRNIVGELEISTLWSGENIQLLSGHIVQIPLSGQSLSLQLSGDAKISLVQWYHHLYRIPTISEEINKGRIYTSRMMWQPIIDVFRRIYSLQKKKLYSYAPATLVSWSHEEIKNTLDKWREDYYLKYRDNCSGCDKQREITQLFYRFHYKINNYNYHHNTQWMSNPYNTKNFSWYLIPIGRFGYGVYSGKSDLTVLIQAWSEWVEWTYSYQEYDPISYEEKKSLLEFISQ